ncbi:MAG: PAS domain S-box protein [Pseudomonadota bacterium]
MTNSEHVPPEPDALKKNSPSQKQTDQELNRLAQELRERVKELNCLYGISYLIEKPGISFDDVAKRAVDLICAAWRYPEVACARIAVKGQEFKTINFKETGWKQAAGIVSEGESIGALEVCYLEEKPVGDEGPFQKEERALIDTIAERLGLVFERQETRNRLLESEKKYRMVVDNANVGILVTQDGFLKLVNPEGARIAGYSEADLTSRPFIEFVHPDDRVMVSEYHLKRLNGEPVPDSYILRMTSRDGGTKWLEKKGVLISWEGRPASLNFIVDVSDRKQADDLIRNLSQMLLQAQERERQMVSYELHDRIAQNLSILKIGCDTLFDDQHDISPELRKKAAKHSKLIEQTISAVRGLAYDLRPPGLDEIGLVHSLELHCEEFSKNSGIRVDFQSAGLDHLDMDDNIKIHIVRLVQEGLNNIQKHADAGTAAVRLLGALPNVILRIEDNGIGFDVEARKRALDGSKRMGLRSMEERVNLLKGQMTVQSHPGQGTKIAIKFAAKEENRDTEKADHHR